MQTFTNFQILGENEGIKDPTFRKRGNCHFESLSYDNYCPMNETDWSELKTSLAVNELLNDTEKYQTLSKFILTINSDLINALQIDPIALFEQFVNNSNFNTANIQKEMEEVETEISDIRSELQMANASETLDPEINNAYWNIKFTKMSNKEPLTKEDEYILYIYEKQAKLENLFRKLEHFERKLNYTNALHYPISQYQTIEPKKHKSDFFVQFHFTKYITEKELNVIKTSNTITSSSFQVMLIFDLRQKINRLLGIVRGPRMDRYKNQKVSKQVGITRVKVDRLDRKLQCSRKRSLDSDCENVEILPWAHPGQAQCYVPYRGGYGRFLKQNKDTYYGSQQCGISGSSQYLSFAFLMSLLHYRTKDLENTDYKESFNVLCQSAFLILVGDGGHNFVEVLYGIMFSLLFFRKLVEFCQTNGDYSIVNDMYHVETDAADQIEIRTMLIAKAFRTVMPFLNYVYERTSNINFMHIDKEHDMLDIANYQEKFQGFSKEYFENLLDEQIMQDPNNIMFHLQFMFAFDPIVQTAAEQLPRYRFEINETENNSNLQLLIQSILPTEQQYDDLIFADLQRVKRDCDVNLKQIPFAMKHNKSKLKHLG
jgi:hypothetical protein